MNKKYLPALFLIFLANSLIGGKNQDLEICIIMKRNNTRDQVIKTIKQTKNVNVKNHLGFTPLILAIIRQDSEIVQELLKQGADPTLCTSKRVKPMDLANKILKQDKTITRL